MKAQYLEIVFVTSNPQAVALYSPGGLDERALPPAGGPLTAAEDALLKKVDAAIAQFVMANPAASLNFFWADYYKAGNIQWINTNGIAQFPSVQIMAAYPDGSQAFYKLNTTITDQRNYSTQDMVRMLEALASGSQGTEKSLICRLIPPLCTAGAYVWLALAAGATVVTISSKRKPIKIAAALGSTMLWSEFFDRGGFKAVLPAKTPEP